MYNEDPLCENAYFTGLKWVVPMFIFLILLAWPMLKITIGSELNIMAAGISGIARISTTPHVDQFALNKNTVSYAAKPGTVESIASQIPPAR